MPLTDTKIKALKPKGKAYKIADEKGLYMYILINPTGSKLWRHKFRVNKKEKLLSMAAIQKFHLKKHGVSPDAVHKWNLPVIKKSGERELLLSGRCL